MKKLRVRKAKVSRKAFDYPAFEQVTREGADDPRFAKVAKKTGDRMIRQRQPIAGQRSCGIGYVSLKNMPDIARRFAEDRDSFSKHLNEFVEAVFEIVLDTEGKVHRFSSDGILYAYENTAKASGATQAAVTGLKIRYRMNKLNRSWEFFHDESWKIRTGVCAGPVAISAEEEEGGFSWNITGQFADLAKAISRSASPGQVLVTDDAYNDPKFDQALFEAGKSRVMQPRGFEFSTRVREIVAMVRSRF